VGERCSDSDEQADIDNEGDAVTRDAPPSFSAAAVTAPLKSAACCLPVKPNNSPYSAAACPPSIPKSAWASMHWVQRRQALECLSAEAGTDQTRKSSARTMTVLTQSVKLPRDAPPSTSASASAVTAPLAPQYPLGCRCPSSLPTRPTLLRLALLRFQSLRGRACTGCNAARPWNVCQPRLERTEDAEEQCSDSDGLDAEHEAAPRDAPPSASASASAVTAPLASAVSASVSMPVKSSNSPYSAAACPPSIPKSAWASMHWVQRRQALERLSAEAGAVQDAEGQCSDSDGLDAEHDAAREMIRRVPLPLL